MTLICPNCKATLGAVVKQASEMTVPAFSVPVPPAEVTGLQLVSLPSQPPQPDPVNVGIPIGAFHYPIDKLGTGSYNATALTVNAATLLWDLANVKATNGKAVLLIPRPKMKDLNGLSLASTKAELSHWPNIAPFIEDKTVLAVYVGDDVTANEWGPAPMVDRMAVFDMVAGEVKRLWPKAVTTLRERPTGLAPYTFLHIDMAWAVYRGPQRDGSPMVFRETQVAAAKQLKMKLMIWFNALDGGSGESGILGTYADPKANRWQLAAAEVLEYGREFLPYTQFGIHWQYSPAFSANMPAPRLAAIRAFDTRPDVLEAMKQLRAIADKTPVPV